MTRKQKIEALLKAIELNYNDVYSSIKQGILAGIALRDAELLASFSKENLKDGIDQWVMFWMNQKQNNEQDYQNYLRRAIGVDANMRHHLAKKLHEQFIKAIKGERDDN